MNEFATFKGRRYRVVTMERSLSLLTLLRRGALDHLGSLQGSFSGMSQPQVYEGGILLYVAACSCNSQHIDIVYALHPR